MIALLLDRDGTLMDDVGYPNDPDLVRLVPGAAAAVRELVRHRFYPAVVSNQSGIARKLITPAQAAAVHDRFVELFIDAAGLRLPCFYCTHGPDEGCGCRKPKPGLLHEAIDAMNLTGRPAVMVGDKPSDVAAGKAAGAVAVWLSFGREYSAHEPSPDVIATNWVDCLAKLRRAVRPRVAA
jgi:histidinol-phosphate phosphatase family protein